ncbi:MAG: InlB B-repeat-containing protein, partial [Firmicutes bacterium]|nr:InlB B-repeat-containing protein [Bacillota bacterium]
MKTNKLRRALGIVIAAVMVFTMVPVMAMAEETRYISYGANVLGYTINGTEETSFSSGTYIPEGTALKFVYTGADYTDGQTIIWTVDNGDPAQLATYNSNSNTITFSEGFATGVMVVAEVDTSSEPDPAQTTDLTVVDMLTISDPIAPINGEAPKTAIAETEQYTGTIEWQGDPETFSYDTRYTATITLTAKEGYTFEGVAENSFEVPSAASCSNAANSGVITAAFNSPWNGYVTDGNGLAAYRINGGYVDIINTFNGRWVSTTYANYGYGVIYKIGNGGNNNLSAIGEEVDIGEGLTMKVEPSFSDGGLFVNLKYTIRNTGTEDKVISFGGHADIKIADDDYAPITKFEDGRGFRMVNIYNGCEFKFFGKGTLGVTDVDTFWFGSYSSRYDNIFTQVEAESYSGDSGMAYSWKDRTIPADKTRVFSLVMGAGDAQAGENVIGVNFDPQNGSDIISVKVDTAGDTITPPADPEYEGYIFGGWYTEPECDNPFDFDTPITETITLYAKWIKSYTITITEPINGTAEADKTTATAGEEITITAKPDDNYEVGQVTATYGDSQNLDITVCPDRQFKFTMPEDNVTVTVPFESIAPDTFTITVTEGTADKTTAAAGEVITVTADNKAGYTFKEWTITEGTFELADNTNAETTFEMPAENVALSATFTKNSSVKPGGGGSGIVSFILTYETNGGESIKTESHKAGDSVTLDKIPVKEGYTFTGWYADKECTQKIESVTMNSSKTVYAGWSDGEQPVKPDENAPLMVIRIGDTKYQLNGVDMEMDAAPFIDENDRTMLPVRVVANALGISDADIAWDNTTKTACFTRPDGKVVSCTVGSNIIKIGDEEVEIDTAPVI